MSATAGAATCAVATAEPPCPPSIGLCGMSDCLLSGAHEHAAVLLAAAADFVEVRLETIDMSVDMTLDQMVRRRY